MATTTTVPGLNLPTQQAMLAGNPRDSAIATQAASTAKLAALNKAVTGGSRSGRHRNSRKNHTCRCHCSCKYCRKCSYKHGRRGATRHHKGATRKRGGAAAATVQVPQFTMQYQPTGGPGQTPNDIIKNNSQISTQTAANAVYDDYAKQKGGYIYSQKHSPTASTKRHKKK